MKVTAISIPVLDQEKALNFYTEKLGFIGQEQGIAAEAVTLLESFDR